MASPHSEYEIQQRIRLACGHGPVRLWRNNTGALVDQQGRQVRFGLCRGSSDLIGLRSLEVTPELVGQQIAQFVALEIKTPHGVVSAEQRAFLHLVEQLGGVAAVCRSIEEAEQSLAVTSQLRQATDGSGRTAEAAQAAGAGPPRRAPLHTGFETTDGDRDSDHWTSSQADPLLT
ncbi:VRR-NUC domain-containing protein [Synechococcus sp. CS-1324]|uniref:VRR-NUC domain-containing protein n=1 Tax=Synechococcus sp. CS-1324 TaxID=2847980 RepID=UPI000DAFEEF6|nr:VRR-NUC domain-containing protein [Synechococcus sp. CS-1324]MCT0229751.1 VRR-NUC domain-containing protein [Synechococcus sp. CS-1324]PZV03426.1 MAG: hypothetical protein DCF23_09490 [Cyanobium sp.]